jgi:hypothetical protein
VDHSGSAGGGVLDELELVAVRGGDGGECAAPTRELRVSDDIDGVTEVEERGTV